MRLIMPLVLLAVLGACDQNSSQDSSKRTEVSRAEHNSAVSPSPGASPPAPAPPPSGGAPSRPRVAASESATTGSPNPAAAAPPARADDDLGARGPGNGAALQNVLKDILTEQAAINPGQGPVIANGPANLPRLPPPSSPTPPANNPAGFEISSDQGQSSPDAAQPTGDAPISYADYDRLKQRQESAAPAGTSLAGGAPSVARVGDSTVPEGGLFGADDAGLDPSKFKALQPVFFATNRKIADGPELTLAAITYERSRELKYGLAIVSVPKSHTIGNVERPPSTWIWKAFTGHWQETDAEDFRVQRLRLISRPTLIENLANNPDSVLLFVHGYNVPFEDALFKAAQIAYDANFPGSVLVFSWPSAGDLFGYDYDYQSALFSPGDLLGILRMLTEEIGKKKIYVVVHSMGNQIMMDALQQAALSKVRLNISELVLAAPDVDKDVFLSKVKQIESVADRITLYASSADRALLASDEKSWGTRLGYITADGPVLVDGIETIDVTAVGDDMLGLNHGTYSNNRTVLDDLGRLIIADIHPPSVRTPILRGMPDGTHTKYWLYPP